MTTTALGALLIILAGVGLRGLGVLRPRDGELLVSVVVYLALPALVLLALLRAHLQAELALVPVAGLLIHAALVPVCLVVCRALRLDRPSTGAVITTAAVGNTGFFGVPLIAASGPGLSVPAAVMYDSVANGLVTWISSPAIASAHGADVAPDARGIDWRAVGRALLLPPTWALVLGLALNGAGVRTLPGVAERPCELLAGAVLPLVMVYAGLQFDVRGLPRVWREVAAVAVIRLGLGAVVAWGVAHALGLGGDLGRTVVLMGAMPSAMMSLVWSSRFGLRGDIVAGAVVVTTLLCTVTLPVVHSLVM